MFPNWFKDGLLCLLLGGVFVFLAGTLMLGAAGDAFLGINTVVAVVSFYYGFTDTDAPNNHYLINILIFLIPSMLVFYNIKGVGIVIFVFVVGAFFLGKMVSFYSKNQKGP